MDAHHANDAEGARLVEEEDRERQARCGNSYGDIPVLPHGKGGLPFCSSWQASCFWNTCAGGAPGLGPGALRLFRKVGWLPLWASKPLGVLHLYRTFGWEGLASALLPLALASGRGSSGRSGGPSPPWDSQAFACLVPGRLRRAPLGRRGKAAYGPNCRVKDQDRTSFRRVK